MTGPLTPLRGLALALAGIALVIGWVARIGFEWIVEVVPYETLAILEVLGQLLFYGLVLAMIYVIYRIGKLRVTGSAAESPATSPIPDRTRPAPVPAPGDDLTDALAEIETRGDPAYERIRTRLSRLVFGAESGKTTDRNSNEDKSWTDDPVAAAVLRGEIPPRQVSVRSIWRLIDPTGVPYRREIQRTMWAIVEAIDDSGVIPARFGPVRRRPAPSVADSTTGLPARRETGRWTGITALALLGLVVGVAYREPTIILVGAVALGFGAYARIETARTPALVIERVIDDPEPAAGEPVTVTVTARNAGPEPLPDCRIVDGVPPALAVGDGSPAIAVRLEPDRSVTWTYSVVARRGRHDFEPVLVRSRTIAGSAEVDASVPATGSTVITCRPTAESVIPSDRSARGGTRRAGGATAATPGDGTAFHSIHPFRPGDPIRRIDWFRYARTGELASVAYEADRTRIGLVIVDARRAAYLAPPKETGRHTVDRACELAVGMVSSWTDASRPIGVATLSADPLWLPPGTGPTHRERVVTALTEHSSVSPLPPPSTGFIEPPLEHLPIDRSDIWIVSPLCDDEIVDPVRTVDARGGAVHVIAPNPTHRTTVEGAIAGLERRRRIEHLRQAGIHVTDVSWSASGVDARGGLP